MTYSAVCSEDVKSENNRLKKIFDSQGGVESETIRGHFPHEMSLGYGTETGDACYTLAPNGSHKAGVRKIPTTVADHEEVRLNTGPFLVL